MVIAFYKVDNSKGYGRNSFDHMDKAEDIYNALNQLQEEEWRTYDLSTTSQSGKYPSLGDFVEDYNDQIIDGDGWFVIVIPEDNTKFNNLEQFNKEFEIVNDFHKKVFNTILEHLKKHGDITIPEEDEDEYMFCYLDKDGTFLTIAVRLESETSFYLDTEDEDGDKCKIYWEDINRDMIIEEKLIELVFNTESN